MCPRFAIRKGVKVLSRLDIMTPSRAQTVIDGLYRDVERRIAASPPGLCPVDLAMNFLNLCHAQTCGKCVPCRVGLGQLSDLMESVLDGKATMETIALIERTARVIVNSADCAIGRDAARLVLDGIQGFRDDYEEHVLRHRCLGGMQNPVPCVALCPAGVDIPGYTVLVKYGRYADAVRLIRQCPVLAAPQTASGQMLALDIARSALGEALDGKTIVPLYFAMSRDPAALAASHEKAAAAVQQYLDAGQDVAMLNIGDVSIYATFGYLQEILQAGGYATAMAAGVPSFCAAAARLNVPLTGGMDTPLTIAPGGWTDRVLEMPGTKVLMKAGRQLPVLLDTLQQADKLKKSVLVCNCGLPDERVYPDLSLERPQEQAGYFATVLVKE